MKILNIILSVLVLLAAAASAVFSYFLYEKRVTLVKGWSQLSESVGGNARTMDRDSGTSAAKELTAEKLGIKGYKADAMDRSLAAAGKQVRELVAQRNDLAEALAVVGEKNSAGVNAADLKTVAASGEQSRKVVNAVSRAIDARNRIYSELRRLAGVDDRKLARGDSSGLEPLRKLVSDANAAKRDMSNIARRVGSDSSDSRSVYQAVDRKVRESDAMRGQLSQKESEIYRYKNAIADRDKQIVAINRVVAEKDEQIAHLKKALGLDPKVEFAVWKNGSPEARARLAGKVTQVSEDYGYIVIDLGTSSVVKQPAGKKELEINLALVKGVELAVVRDGKFIAAVTLDNVGEKDSTANIPVDKVGQIKVGDSVVCRVAAKK